MKLNDFKQSEQKVREGFWDALIGDRATSTLKSMGSGKTGQQQLAMDIFIKDFVGDALTALETGVKSGLIDPNAKSKGAPKAVNPAAVKPAPGTPGAAAPAAPAPAAPAAGAAPAAKPSTAPAVGKFKQQQQTTQNMNSYIQSAAKTLNATADKNQKMALAKELVNYMADRKDYPEWKNGLATVQQVIKKSGLDPNFANSAVNRINAGQKMAEAWKIFYINKLLEAIDLTWEDLGLVVLKESTSKNYIIAESKYYKLNNLFESILTEAESVGDYMKKWFAQYMKGINYSANQADIDKLIKTVEQNYPKVKPQLTQLAQMAFALSKGAAPGAEDEKANIEKAIGSAGAAAPAGAAPAAPAGAAPAGAAPAAAAAKPAAGALNSHQMLEQIKLDLAKLAKTDAKLYNDFIRSLKPAAAPAAPAAGGAAPVAGASAGLAESKRRTK